VPYSRAGDPAGTASTEDALKIRPLLVDGVVKEWTTGDAHDARGWLRLRRSRTRQFLPGREAI